MLLSVDWFRGIGSAMLSSRLESERLRAVLRVFFFISPVHGLKDFSAAALIISTRVARLLSCTSKYFDKIKRPDYIHG